MSLKHLASRTLITVSHSLQRADYGEQPVWMGPVLAAMLRQMGLDGGGYSYSLGALLITHDLAIASERADRLVVLKDGLVQEAGKTADVFTAPKSAYARKLHADVPALNPDRYAGLRDPGFRHPASATTSPAKIEVSGVTKTFTIDGKVLTAVNDVSFASSVGRHNRKYFLRIK